MAVTTTSVRQFQHNSILDNAFGREPDFFSAVLNTVNALVVVLDRGGRIIHFNQACEKISGYPLDEVKGKCPWDFLLLPEEREPVKAAILELHDKHFHEYENHWVTRDGDLRLISWSNTVLLSKDGTVEYIIATGVDITECRQARATLRESKRRFKAIFDLTFEFVCLLAPDGTLLEANQTALNFGGLTRSHIVNRPFWEARWWTISPQTQDFLKSAVAEAARGKFVRYEVDLPGANDRIVTVDFSLKPILDGAGRVVHLIAEGRDITERKQMEAKLQKSHQHIATILESITDAFVSLDRQWRFTYLNPEAERLYKHSRDELIGKVIWDTFPHVVGKVFDHQYRRAVAEQVAVHFEAYSETVKKWIEVHAYPSQEGLSLYIRDISERKEAERALKDLASRVEHEAKKLDDIISTSSDYVFLFDRTGKCTYTSIDEITALGITRSEIVGKTFAELRHASKTIELFAKRFKEVLATAQPVKGKTRFPTDNGIRHFEYTLSPVRHPDGSVDSVVATFRDITERKKTEEILRKSEELYRSLVEALPDSVILTDLDGTIVMTNQQAAASHGYKDAGDLKGENVFNFMVAEERERTLEKMRKTLETGNIRNVQYTLLRPDGTCFPAELNASLVLNSAGQPKGYIGIIRDVTERKKTELEMARLDRLNLVGEMAAGIAHEIRNPMTAARGFIQLLGEREECKPFKGYFSLITEELDRANLIITGFLSLAKHNLLQLRRQNLNSIVENLLPLVRADAATRDLYVHTVLNKIPDLLLDEKEIRQLVLNLCRNALEVMSPGDVLTLRTYVNGQEIVLAVQDQGTGIEPEVLAKLGTPFFTTKEQGTGLGLAVCFCIAHRHNATVNVKTGPTGSTFLVRFSNNSQS